MPHLPPPLQVGASIDTEALRQAVTATSASTDANIGELRSRLDKFDLELKEGLREMSRVRPRSRAGGK